MFSLQKKSFLQKYTINECFKIEWLRNISDKVSTCLCSLFYEQKFSITSVFKYTADFGNSDWVKVRAVDYRAVPCSSNHTAFFTLLHVVTHGL